MIEKADVVAAGKAAAEKAGYTVAGVGTRHNGDGTTGFIWDLRKGEKKYMVENAVHLGNVTSHALGTVFPKVMANDLLSAREYK
jgi:hypothetical protein